VHTQRCFDEESLGVHAGFSNQNLFAWLNQR